MLKKICENRICIGMTVGAMALFTALTSVSDRLPHIVYTNTTPSLPVGFYLAIPGGSFRDGDLVAYRPPDEVINTVKEYGWYQRQEDVDNLIFIKRAYNSGTIYEVKGDNLTVGNKVVGKVFDKDVKGHPMPQHQGRYRVGKDEFFPLGDHERSFDGRYTGTVEKKRIISRVVPFLTFR